MEKKYLTLILITSFILLSTTLFFFTPIHKTEYQALFHVTGSNIGGFDVTTENLFFGIVPKNGHNTKSITINNLDQKVRVVITAKGNIAEHLSVSDNNFIIKSYEQENITFIASGKNTDIGHYKGIVRIYFYRPFIF